MILKILDQVLHDLLGIPYQDDEDEEEEDHEDSDD